MLVNIFCKLSKFMLLIFFAYLYRLDKQKVLKRRRRRSPLNSTGAFETLYNIIQNEMESSSIK